MREAPVGIEKHGNIKAREARSERAKGRAAKIRTGYQIRRVGAEGAVPDPSLVALKNLFELELPITPDRPDLHCRISGTCCKISDIEKRMYQ